MGNNNTATQGGFSFGPSGYDAEAIANALSSNTQATTNRYNQLGLGGSTMAGQDQNFQDLAANALTGQEQFSDVTKQAINTALQQPISAGNPTKGSSINSIVSGFSNLKIPGG